jgi:D-alanyl-D-alanine carboxypeptidase
MRRSRLASRLQRITALLLCVTVSLAGLATAAGAARPPAQAAAPSAFPPAIQRQFQQALDQTLASRNVPAARAGLQNSLRAELNNYLNTRRVPEHISAVSLRVTYPGTKPPIALAVGTTQYGGGPRLSTGALWQIGSNTKAFTSVMLLQLEAEHKLSISDTLGKWLPQYRAWRRIQIKQLLNMTSGIQDFEQPAAVHAYVAAPNTVVSTSRLVSYVVGLPLQKGYNYSNTNYILAQMIIERVTHDTYADQLRKRIVTPLDLHNLFFSATRYPAAITARMPAGYLFYPGVPELAPLMGKDLRGASVSWSQGAGGIVASLADLTTWVRALYTGRELPRKQQRELESLVSMGTGKPIRQTSAADPLGYGLGLTQGTTSSTGTFWFYEGQTFGYRVLHLYSPRSGIVIAVAVNSSISHANAETACKPLIACFPLIRLGLSLYRLLHASH